MICCYTCGNTVRTCTCPKEVVDDLPEIETTDAEVTEEPADEIIDDKKEVVDAEVTEEPVKEPVKDKKPQSKK